MRIRLLLAAVVLVGCVATSRADSPKEKPKGPPPCDCPLFTIDEWPPDFLYYCDYFETTCGTWTDVGYYVGQFSTPVPWQLCGDHCASRTYHEPSKEFRGLPTKMPLDYMPSRPVPDPRPVPDATPTKSRGVKVNMRRNNCFIRFTIAGTERYAKVFEYCFNRRLAEGGSEEEGVWESRFIARECVKPPQGQTVHDVENFGPLKLFPGPHVRRADLDLGTKVKVLILLAAPQ